MADLKISALTAASTPLAGTEVLPIVQSGTTKKVAVSDLTAGRSISASEVNVSTGNIGVGALSSWATAKAVQVGSYGNISSLNNSTYIGQNFYYNAGFLFQHASARYAALYEQNNFNGTHNWYSSSATGTTGNPVTLNSLATLSQAGDYTLYTGNVVIGTSGKGIDYPSAGSFVVTRGGAGGFTMDSGSNFILTSSGDPRFYSQGVYNVTGGAAANMVVGADGGFYRSTSSLKYKQNVNDAVHGLADLLKLRAVTYESKNKDEEGVVYGGLIAEEVHAAGLTEFVQYAADGTPDALAYGNMVSLCVKAIQEQQVIIDQLRAEIQTLK